MKLLVCVLAAVLLLHVAHALMTDQLQASSQQADINKIMNQVRERMETFRAYGRETVEILDQLSHYHPEEHPQEAFHPQASIQEKFSAKAIAIGTLIASTVEVLAATAGVVVNAVQS